MTCCRNPPTRGADSARRQSSLVIFKTARPRLTPLPYNQNVTGSMLTTEDKEEIKRLVGEMIAESGPTHSERRKHPDDIEDLDRLQNIVDVTARAIEFSEPAKSHCDG